MSDRRREFADSSNGDRWFLSREAKTGVPYFVHVANQSSGGAVTRIELARFLNLKPNAPEHQALLLLIGTLVQGAAD